MPPIAIRGKGYEGVPATGPGVMPPRTVLPDSEEVVVRAAVSRGELDARRLLWNGRHTSLVGLCREQALGPELAVFEIPGQLLAVFVELLLRFRRARRALRQSY